MLLEATDWRWPPDVLERQDDLLMEDIAKIANSAGKIKRTLADEKKQDDK